MRVGEKHGAAEADRDRRFRRPPASGELPSTTATTTNSPWIMPPTMMACGDADMPRRRWSRHVNAPADERMLLPPNGECRSAESGGGESLTRSSRITVLGGGG